jgi:uncharacterized membrane protein
VGPGFESRSDHHFSSLLKSLDIAFVLPSGHDATMNAKHAPKEPAPKTGNEFWSHSVFTLLRNYFITGILVTAPLAITIYLTYIFFHFIDSQVSGILPHEVYGAVQGLATIPGLGIVSALVFFIFVGWLATNFLGRFLIRLSDYIMHRVPIINTLYKSTKQVFETLIGSQAQAFREVVMIEYPRKGSWTLGFVTGFTKGEIQDATPEDLINIFVPTSPSPANGFLLFIPRSELIPLKMSVDEGIKMVISMGIITPDNNKQIEKPQETV